MIGSGSGSNVHKVNHLFTSSQLLRMLTKEESERAGRERQDLHAVLNMGQVGHQWVKGGTIFFDFSLIRRTGIV